MGQLSDRSVGRRLGEPRFFSTIVRTPDSGPTAGPSAPSNTIVCFVFIVEVVVVFIDFSV